MTTAPPISALRGPRSLIHKADLAISDLVTDGGYLQPAQAKQFIRQVIEASTLMQQVIVRPMASHTEELSLIKFGSRILRPGTAGAALSAGDRSKPTTSKVELVSKLFKAEVDLEDTVLEDNIEQAQLQNTILSLMAERIATDMEDVVINGDVLDADPTLAVLDGIRKQATSNTHDFAGSSLNKDDLSDLLRVVPARYRKFKSRMRYMTSHDAEEDYRNSLASRATVAGDRFVLEDVPAMYSGIPVEAYDVWPEDLGGGNDQTQVLLTDPKNIVVGIWRQVKIELDRDVRAGINIIVASVRFDVKYVEEEAVAKGINVQL